MISRILAVTALLALAGCGGIRQTYPESRSYSLVVRREGPAREVIPGVYLTVTSFEISRRSEGEQMVYRLEDNTWESDFYNRFLVPPAQLVTEETKRWLERAGIAEVVLEPSSYLDITHGVEGVITTMHGDYHEPGRPAAVLEMSLFGVHRKGSKVLVLTQRHYAKRVPVADRTSAALVTGWESALREILTDFEGALAEAIAADRS